MGERLYRLLVVLLLVAGLFLFGRWAERKDVIVKQK